MAAGPGVPRCAAFSPDGAALAVGLTRGGVVLLDVATGIPQARLTSFSEGDATFAEALPGGEVSVAGADAAPLVACRVGRFVLPAAACAAP